MDEETKHGKPEFISTLIILSDGFPTVKTEMLNAKGRVPEDEEKEKEAQQVLLESHLIDWYLQDKTEDFKLGQTKTAEEGDYIIAITDLESMGDTAFIYFYRKDTKKIVFLDGISTDDYVFATTKLVVKKFNIAE